MDNLTIVPTGLDPFSSGVSVKPQPPENPVPEAASDSAPLPDGAGQQVDTSA